MLVSELIKRLSKYPPNIKVVMEDADGWEDDNVYLHLRPPVVHVPVYPSPLDKETVLLITNVDPSW